MGEDAKYCDSRWEVSSSSNLYLNTSSTNAPIRDQEFLESLVAEVEKNVDGRKVLIEGEDDEVEMK